MDEGKFMFSNRVCQQWNDLPGKVVGSGSVNGFKRGVDKILKEAIGESFWSRLDLFGGFSPVTSC